ncbi:hypothetical protein D5366_10185 [Neokomagataea tanensis]|uniref:Methylamine utilization protein MauD n=2 Tax=Neokomagataea TaxID=1223423 RepID=A0A4Y6V641_9PROT|nr:hypothetical protein [Neokomagataea tanensis]QDH25519.1 hypothetical protein D5366_10185 [Neokomagataea tanensis]
MMDIFSLFYVHVGLWVCVGTIIFASILIQQHMNKLFSKIAPIGALTPNNLLPGALPYQKATMLDGSQADLKEACLLFVDASCPVSRKMIPIARSFAHKEQRLLILCTDAPENSLDEACRVLRAEANEITNGPVLGQFIGVDRLPFGVLVSDDYTVLARGLVNSREHLESLSVSVKTGYASIQNYLENNKYNIIN